MKKYENLNLYEHEIPNGSKLYFDKTAQLKRDLERRASEILTNNGFKEIVTPFFSYHQHLSVASANLLRFSDTFNNEINLRADSTIDVVRIVRARLKNTSDKKWFYIQPVFRYPSTEIYQIGAEIISEPNLTQSIDIVSGLIDDFKLNATLQISNIEIPKIISEILDIDIAIFEKVQLEKIFSLNISWLNKLAVLSSVSGLKDILNEVPNEIKEPLMKLSDLALNVGYKNLKIVPLYYSKMRYYDSLFFRFLIDNSILAGGGNYKIDGEISSGFAIYTDTLIEKITLKEMI